MSEVSKCTNYIINDEEGKMPCRCPRCGGFLKWVRVYRNGVPTGEDRPVCNNCHAELIVLPDHDEETGEEMECGRICDITLPRKEE
jgi:hypothetical protein